MEVREIIDTAVSDVDGTLVVNNSVEIGVALQGQDSIFALDFDQTVDGKSIFAGENQVAVVLDLEAAATGSSDNGQSHIANQPVTFLGGDILKCISVFGDPSAVNDNPESFFSGKQGVSFIEPDSIFDQLGIVSDSGIDGLRLCEALDILKEETMLTVRDIRSRVLSKDTCAVTPDNDLGACIIGHNMEMES